MRPGWAVGGHVCAVSGPTPAETIDYGILLFDSGAQLGEP